MSTPITALPKDFKDPNKWADYWELRCISSEEKTFSRDDMLNLLKDQSIDRPSNYSPEDPRKYLGSKNGEADEQTADIVNTWWEMLDGRNIFFGNTYYPFFIDGTTLGLRPRLTAVQKIYLGCLFASNLDYASKHTADLTTWFEGLSAEITKGILPDSRLARCYRFGKGAYSKPARYKGNIQTKLEKLGHDLHLSFRSDFERDCKKDPNYLHKKSTGDKGLDIVAWIEFDDSEALSPLYLGQCACGANWEGKQFEAHSVVWKDIFQFSVEPLTILYIPRSYRHSNGEFWHRSSTHNLIFFDRYRILKLANQQKPIGSLLHSTVYETFKHFQSLNLSYVD
ncbi:MAG: hypothetical protein ACKVUS_07800 [Saprospiraceae bacterium]